MEIGNYLRRARDLIRKGKILFALIVIQLLMLLLLVWSPPIIDNKQFMYYRADPHGTGRAVDIRQTSILYYNGIVGYQTWEIVNADGSTTLVAEFFYDREGNLQQGSWKWENGVYYVWVVGDNGEGAWVSSEPPPDRQPPP